jgi:DNA-binding response OmpR family regulator
VALDIDLPQFDSGRSTPPRIKTGQTSVLVLTESPERGPAALKAGCHGVLLKPFAPNLVAARLGRLVRETLLDAGRAACRRRPAAARHQSHLAGDRVSDVRS